MPGPDNDKLGHHLAHALSHLLAARAVAGVEGEVLTAIDVDEATAAALAGDSRYADAREVFSNCISLLVDTATFDPEGLSIVLGLEASTNGMIAAASDCCWIAGFKAGLSMDGGQR